MRKTWWLGIACGVCVLVLSSSPALAWDKQEHYTNYTSESAYDLTKILWGDYAITDAIHAPFQSHVVVKWPSNILPLFTIIHWYNPIAPVPPGGMAYACFSIAGDAPIHVLGAWWTRADGTFIGWAGPNLAQSHRWTAGQRYFRLKHRATHWTGSAYPPAEGDTSGDPMGPFTVTDAACANIRSAEYTLDELNEGLFTDPAISWYTLASGLSLSYDDEYEWQLPSACVGASTDHILVRFTVSDGTKQTVDIAQFSITARPTLSQWGTVAVVVLLLGTGAWLIYRRRVMTQA